MKVLLLQTAFLGDAVLTLPLIEKLHKKFPDSQIDVVAIPSTKSVFTLSPFVNNIFVFDKKEAQKSLASTILFGLTLKKRNYDLIVSPHRSARSAIIAFLTGGKRRISFDTSSLSFLFNERVQYRKEFHEVKRNLSLICNSKELEDWRNLPEIVIKSEDKEYVKNLCNKFGLNQYIILAPGSVWETKKYPWKYFAEVAKYFAEKDFTVVLIGGEADKNLCESILVPSSQKIINFCGKLSIPQSVELIEKSELLITNDSAPTHLGVIADAKVLTLYASTVPEFGFYPYNKRSDYLSLDLDCKPCGIHGRRVCPLEHFNCGNLLLPNEVIAKAEKLLIGR